MVALLGLGLIGAITFLGDSFESKTYEVGNAVTRLEGLNGASDANSAGNTPFTHASETLRTANPTGSSTQNDTANYTTTAGDFTSTTAADVVVVQNGSCLLYTSPSPRDATLSRMPSSA